MGDEVRDIQSARKAGGEVPAVTWSYHISELLAEQAPDYLMKLPEQLLTLLDGSKH